MRRGSRMQVLAVLSIVITSACSSYGPSETEPVDPASYEDDREYDWQACPLTDLLVRSSHLLDVTITASSIVEMESGPVYGLTRRDRAAPPTLADLTDVRVDEVLFERAVDPRAAVYPLFADQATLSLLSRRDGGVIVALGADGLDVVGEQLVVATGQFRVGSIEEWPIHLAFRVDDHGEVDFVGPCAAEFDRQLESMVSNVFPELAGLAAFDQITAVMSAALDPEIGGNLKHFARPALARPIGDGLLPSMVAPDVRRVHFVVVPSGPMDGAFSLQSSAGNGSEFFGTFQSEAVPYASGALVSHEGPITLALNRGGTSWIADPLDAPFTGSLDGVEALRVDLDVDTMTTVITPIALEEIAEIVPFTQPIDDLRRSLALPIVPTPGTASIDWIPAS